MKYGLTEIQLNNILNTFKQFKEIEEVILFGSRAMNTFKPTSDIDIALKGAITLNTISNLQAKLEELNMIHPFDVVNHHNISNSDFLKRINQYGIRMYLNGWVETTLADTVSKLGDGLHGTPKYSDDGEYYFINGNNLNEGKIQLKKETKKCSKEEYEKYKKNLNSRTILVSINGSLGYFAYYNNEKCFLGKSACYFHVKDSISKHFIGYQIRTQYFQKYIERLAGGTTIKNVSLKTMREFPFIIPKNIDEQRAIAEILTAFDDKIENLQAQNNTLETTAQTIFKEWFGKYQIGDDLPEGWRVGKLGEVLQLKSGYAFKGKDFIDESNFKALKIKDLKGNGNVSISNVSSINESCTKIERVQYFRLKEGNIVLAMSGNTTGKIGVIPPHSNEIYLNQRVGKFFLKDENQISFLYNFLMSGNFEEKILSMGYGSAQPNISPSQIEDIDIIFPDDDKLQEYLNLSNPFFDKVLMNNDQIQTLKKTRDTLLPKLMSGALRVNEFKETAV